MLTILLKSIVNTNTSSPIPILCDNTFYCLLHSATFIFSTVIY